MYGKKITINLLCLLVFFVALPAPLANRDFLSALKPLQLAQDLLRVYRRCIQHICITPILCLSLARNGNFPIVPDNLQVMLLFVLLVDLITSHKLHQW